MIKTKNKNLSTDEIKARLFPLFDDQSLRLVLLFGSSVTGKLHRQSDIDLAFLFDIPVDMVKLTNRVVRLLHADNVDIIDLIHANPLLRFSAAKNSAVLFEKEPGMFCEFCSLAFRIYEDTKKLREARSESIKRFLELRKVG